MPQTTSAPPGSPPVPVTVEEIERRIRWPALPALLFLGIMLGLGVVALVGSRREPPILTGLPDDPDVRAAGEAAQDVDLATGPLRLRSALLGEADSPAPIAAEGPPAGVSWVPEPPTREEQEAIRRASARLEVAEERHPRDPRVLAALGALDLAAGSLERAEQRYRQASEWAPGYGEARLGLGVTMALIGARALGERDQRRMLLRAIAQLAAVRPRDPAHEAALYDRVLLLERVGRDEDARRFAEEFRRRYP